MRRIFKDVTVFDKDDQVIITFSVNEDERTTSSYVEVNGQSGNNKLLHGSFSMDLGTADNINRVEIFTDLTYLKKSDNSGINVSFSPVPQQGQQARDIVTGDDTGGKGDHADYLCSFRFYQ